MNCYFTMSIEHTAYADEVATRIHAARKLDGKEFIGHRRSDDVLSKWMQGIRCEMAFYLWLGGKSSGAVWDCAVHQIITLELARHPDIVFRDHKIDVKRGFLLRKTQLNLDHVYVFADDATYPRVKFMGWLPACEIADCRIAGRSDIPAYSVDGVGLNDCMMFKGHAPFKTIARMQ